MGIGWLRDPANKPLDQFLSEPEHHPRSQGVCDWNAPNAREIEGNAVLWSGRVTTERSRRRTVSLRAEPVPALATSIVKRAKPGHCRDPAFADQCMVAVEAISVILFTNFEAKMEIPAKPQRSPYKIDPASFQ